MTMWKPLLFVAAVTAATGAQAATRDALVVTPAWLASHAADKDVVVLHVGTSDGYAAGHIPGAHLVDAKLLQVSTPELKVEVPPADLLHQQMESLGISDNSHVIVYNETGEFQRATRVLFTLDVAGFGDHSSLLDGGLAEWK
ncbi:MAG: rhodanese-like domain-containing protein, partial [Rhizomicrobium sp.]